MHSESTPIICTGFHRSGTSLTAQILQEAGVNLGANLMGGGFSNPDGHFEDWDVVQVHDRLLKQQELTWQATSPYPSDVLTTQNAINKYTNQRTSSFQGFWGVKDPRLSLFLPYWHQSLSNKGIFIFPVRHWTQCVQSLHSRHAKLFAYQLFPQTISTKHLDFWINPLLASKMWLNYNSQILKFIKHHPDNCFVLPHQRLLQGDDFISKINQRFGITLDQVDYPSIIKHKYHTSSKILPIVTDSLPNTLIAQMNDLYDELLNYTDSPKPYQSESKTPNPILWQSAKELVEQAPLQSSVTNNSNKIDYQDINKLSFEETVDYIKSTNILNTSNDFKYLYSLTNHILTLRPHFWKGHEWHGRLHLRLGQYEKAHQYFKDSVIYTDQPPPYLHHLLSQASMESEQLQLALHYIMVAIQKNPNNPNFYLQKISILNKLNRQNSVRKTLVKANQKFSNNSAIYLRLLEFDYKKQPTVTLEQAEKQWQQPDSVFYHNFQLGNWLSDKMIENNSDSYQALIIKKRIMQDKMKQTNKNQWLYHIISQIKDNKQAHYLVYLILHAWQKLE